MSLTMGRGPFGHIPAGSFNRALPAQGTLFLDPFQRRVRGVLDGEVVVDTTGAWMLHEHGVLPRLYFPPEDVRAGLLRPSSTTTPRSDTTGTATWFDVVHADRTQADVAWRHTDLPAGTPAQLGELVAFYFRTMDEWLEEDLPMLGHARDPYHRVDAVPTSRHIRISLGGTLLAESRRPKVIFETGLQNRWYLPREDIVADLEPSALRTTCAYKGEASYWSVRVGDDLRENLAWTYADPRHDADAVRGHVAFFDEQIELEIDGVAQPHAAYSPWASPTWWKDLAGFADLI